MARGQWRTSASLTVKTTFSMSRSFLFPQVLIHFQTTFTLTSHQEALCMLFTVNVAQGKQRNGENLALLRRSESSFPTSSCSWTVAGICKDDAAGSRAIDERASKHKTARSHLKPVAAQQ